MQARYNISRTIHYFCSSFMFAGLRSLEVQFLTDLLKTWHFQLQDLYRKEGHCTVITKQI